MEYTGVGEIIPHATAIFHFIRVYLCMGVEIYYYKSVKIDG